MFVTFRTKRGYRAVNVSEIVSLDYRPNVLSEEGVVHGGLDIQFRTRDVEGEAGRVRIKGEQAHRLWRLLEEKGLLWVAEGEPEE